MYKDYSLLLLRN